MESGKKVISLWILVQPGLTGTENQLSAIAKALEAHGSVDVRSVGLWRWLCHARPDLVLAAGRKAVLPALILKLLGHRVAFVQDPRWFRFAFDRIYCPRHDGARGRNVVFTDGSPTAIGPMNDAGEAGTVALLIGGGRKGVIPTAPDLPAGRYLATFSRRTPDAIKTKMRTTMRDAEIYDPAAGGANPYRDFLKRAETIAVTDDSVSMLSDACSTGRGVYILPFLNPGGRLKAFADHLVAIGAARRFTGSFEPFEPRSILKDAEKVAADIAGCLLPR